MNLAGCSPMLMQEPKEQVEVVVCTDEQAMDVQFLLCKIVHPSLTFSAVSVDGLHALLLKDFYHCVSFIASCSQSISHSSGFID